MAKFNNLSEEQAEELKNVFGFDDNELTMYEKYGKDVNIEEFKTIFGEAAQKQQINAVEIKFVLEYYDKHPDVDIQTLKDFVESDMPSNEIELAKYVNEVEGRNENSNDISEYLEALKEIDTRNLDERSFYEQVLSVVQEMDGVSLTPETAGELKATLEEIGCMPYKDWKAQKELNGETVEAHNYEIGVRDAEIATAVSCVSQLMSDDYGDVNYSLLRMLDGGEEYGWVQQWLKNSRERSRFNENDYDDYDYDDLAPEPEEMFDDEIYGMNDDEQDIEDMKRDKEYEDLNHDKHDSINAFLSDDDISDMERNMQEVMRLFRDAAGNFSYAESTFLATYVERDKEIKYLSDKTIRDEIFQYNLDYDMREKYGNRADDILTTENFVKNCPNMAMQMVYRLELAAFYGPNNVKNISDEEKDLAKKLKEAAKEGRFSFDIAVSPEEEKNLSKEEIQELRQQKLIDKIKEIEKINGDSGVKVNLRAVRESAADAITNHERAGIFARMCHNAWLKVKEVGNLLKENKISKEAAGRFIKKKEPLANKMSKLSQRMKDLAKDYEDQTKAAKEYDMPDYKKATENIERDAEKVEEADKDVKKEIIRQAKEKALEPNYSKVRTTGNLIRSKIAEQALANVAAVKKDYKDAGIDLTPAEEEQLKLQTFMEKGDLLKEVKVHEVEAALNDIQGKIKICELDKLAINKQIHDIYSTEREAKVGPLKKQLDDIKAEQKDATNKLMEKHKQELDNLEAKLEKVKALDAQHPGINAAARIEDEIKLKKYDQQQEMTALDSKYNGKINEVNRQINDLNAEFDQKDKAKIDDLDNRAAFLQEKANAIQQHLDNINKEAPEVFAKQAMSAEQAVEYQAVLTSAELYEKTVKGNDNPYVPRAGFEIAPDDVSVNTEDLSELIRELDSRDDVAVFIIDGDNGRRVNIAACSPESALVIENFLEEHSIQHEYAPNKACEEAIKDLEDKYKDYDEAR